MSKHMSNTQVRERGGKGRKRREEEGRGKGREGEEEEERKEGRETLFSWDCVIISWKPG